MAGDWERSVQQIAGRMAYPATPELWPAVRSQLEQSASRRARLRPHWAMVVGAVALAVGLALFSIPDARAALYRVVRLGVIRIFIEPATATPGFTPGPTVSSSATTTPPKVRAPFDLQGATSLDSAQAALGEAFRLPTYPEEIGQPDLVFLQSVEGPMAVLVWLEPADTSQARLALYILGSDVFGGKTSMRLIEETEVGGQPALWLVGPHALVLQSGEMVFRSLVEGNVLVWQEGDMTYRLETDLPLVDAVRVAESLE